MEVARPFFHTPQPQHHLAELRIEADQSPVAFSDPCAVGRKRRCLFPAFSPRKKMLLELPPFPSAPASSPPASTGHTARVGSNGSFAFRALPEQPLAPVGSNSSDAFAFLASHERPLTPMGSSTASSGPGILASQPSLSPCLGGPTGTAAFSLLASPKPALAATNVGEGLTFLASPLPAFGRLASPVSPAAKELAPAGHGVSGRSDLVVSPPRFVLSASRTSASPVRNSSNGGTLWSRRRKSKQQWEEQLQITLPPQNVAKRPDMEALATGESPRRATLSESSAKPCCAFLNSAAKASKQLGSPQDAPNAILAASDAFHQPTPAGTCCTFSPVEKASKHERGVQAPSVTGEGPTSPSPAARPGAGLVVRVTCSCGARKEFCFDHCH